MHIWRSLNTAIKSFILVFTFFFSMIESSECEVLELISSRATESQSDTVLILHRGKIIGSLGAGKQYQPIETRSVTKSFVSLAVGLLIQEGKISSLDTPVYCYYPEWRQGIRQRVTLRHLLTHTSGMEIGDGSCDFYQFPDLIRMALSTDFTNCPGERFFYNNKAVNLLAGIVEKIAGMNIQQYLKKSLFLPLGITSDSWLCDPVGNCFGMSHLTINAVDLSKIGMLVAQKGCWNGRRLLSSQWLDFMMEPSQTLNPFYSLLWWLDYDRLNLHWDCSLINIYTNAKMPSKYIRALESLDGYVVTLEGRVSYKNYVERCAGQMSSYFGSQQDVYDFFAYIESHGLPIARWDEGIIRSISARGYFGQQLIVFPEYDLIGVRLSSVCGGGAEGQDTFNDFEELLGMLGPEVQNSDCPIVVDPNAYQQSPLICYNCEDDIEFQCPAHCQSDSPFDIGEVPYYIPESNVTQDLPYYVPTEQQPEANVTPEPVLGIQKPEESVQPEVVPETQQPEEHNVEPKTPLQSPPTPPYNFEGTFQGATPQDLPVENSAALESNELQRHMQNSQEPVNSPVNVDSLQKGQKSTEQ